MMMRMRMIMVLMMMRPYLSKKFLWRQNIDVVDLAEDVRGDNSDLVVGNDNDKDY